DEGAAGHSALDIARELERLGAQLETTATFDASFVQLTVLRSRLEPALRIFADVALRPDFPARELDRVRAEHVAAIKQRAADPRQVAQLVLDAALYGDSAYGAPPAGYLQSVERLTARDVVGFFRSHYHPNQAALVAAGDITAAELQKL